jgi:hypothetical protein
VRIYGVWNGEAQMIAKIPHAYKRKRVLWDAKLHQDDRIFECEAFHISPGGAKIRIGLACSSSALGRGLGDVSSAQTRQASRQALTQATVEPPIESPTITPVPNAALEKCRKYQDHDPLLVTVVGNNNPQMP